MTVAGGSGSGSAQIETAVLEIHPTDIGLNQTIVSDADIVARLTSLADAGIKTVMLSVDQDVTTQRLVDVMVEVQKVGSLQIQIEDPS